ncbi:sensor histidine kinase [Haloplanus sp. GCM10025708]|uniref:sensor histidine kinase n=1 Tax=Haloplanus sp. GCM10025708 TaxID=3252679 RepID=UPI00361BE352
MSGVALLVPNATPFVRGGSAVSLGLGALGTAVSLGLAVSGVLLYRSDFSTPNVVRIAVWDCLGLVVLGGVLWLHVGARGLAGNALMAGNLLAVSATAHVLIGVHDARRVRAEQLAREREKFAVLSRVLRHNLRNEANVLLGHAGQLEAELDDPELASSARVVHERASVIGGLATKARELVSAVERRGGPPLRTNVAGAVATAVDAVDGERVEADVPDDLWVWADEGYADAITELVENAVEHGGSNVAVTAEADGGWVRVRVSDDGGGIPDHERAVVTGDADIDQLTHGSGLGLWVVRTIAESSGGRLGFDSTEDRTVVTLSHRRARVRE